MTRFLLLMASCAAVGYLCAAVLAEDVGRAVDQQLGHYESRATAILSQNPVLGHSGRLQRPGCLHSSPQGVAVFMVAP